MPIANPTVDEMGVAVKSHVDAFDRVPELIERRIEVEIDAARNGLEQPRVGQHPGNVDQHDRSRVAASSRVRRRRGRCLARLLEQQRGAAGQTEGGRHLAEIAGVDRASERRAVRPHRRGRIGSTRYTSWPRLAQPQHVLQHRPRRAALMRVAGDHAADEDAQSVRHRLLSTSKAVTQRQLEPATVQGSDSGAPKTGDVSTPFNPNRRSAFSRFCGINGDRQALDRFGYRQIDVHLPRLAPEVTWHDGSPAVGFGLKTPNGVAMAPDHQVRERRPIGKQRIAVVVAATRNVERPPRGDRQTGNDDEAPECLDRRAHRDLVPAIGSGQSINRRSCECRES